MNDRPTAPELLDAVRAFLEAEVLPALSENARLRFQTLVAANVLSIAARELASEEAALGEEWHALAPIVGGGSRPERLLDLRAEVRHMNEALGDAIRSGAFDDESAFATLAQTLRRVVVRKLEVANPRYLAAPLRQQ